MGLPRLRALPWSAKAQELLKTQYAAVGAAGSASLPRAIETFVYAGAADKGRIYMVDADQAVATAFDVDERAVSQLWFDHNLLGFATDDAAALYRATGRASQAKYVSDVLDAKARREVRQADVGRAAARSSSRPAAATPRSPASAGASGSRRSRSASSAAAPRAARSRARRVATCSSAPRSRTITRACAA